MLATRRILERYLEVVYILKVVCLFSIEVGWSCDRHDCRLDRARDWYSQRLFLGLRGIIQPLCNGGSLVVVDRCCEGRRVEGVDLEIGFLSKDLSICRSVIG
jgi:hypothetical protein